jgi:proteasome assembly chaperone (PAC2) family protein
MSEQGSSVRLYASAELRRPYLVAAWSGMGAVALLTVNYLRQALAARLLGEIDPYAFFSPSQVVIKDGLIQPPEIPQTLIYYWDQGTEHDLIFLVGTEQPSNAYEMAIEVVELSRGLGVERIYTAAAFPTLIHHTQEPNVWGTATHPHLVRELQAFGASVMDQGTIGGLNGLLLATAKERDMEGMCLLGEIPLYTTQMINPLASRAVLAILCRMFDVQVDLGRLVAWAEDLRPEMDQLYSILPRRIQEATTEEQDAGAAQPEAPQAEHPLVADAKFFDEIESFLQGEEGDEDEGPDEDEEE